MSKFYVEDTQWAVELEKEFEDYMVGLRIYEVDPADLPAGTEFPPTLSGQAYCGCQTCITRETLFFLAPRIAEATLAGKVTVTDE